MNVGQPIQPSVYRRHLSACVTLLDITINFTFEGLFHARIFAVLDEKPIVSRAVARTYYFLASYPAIAARCDPNCRAASCHESPQGRRSSFSRGFFAWHEPKKKLPSFDRENIPYYHVSRCSNFPLSNFSLMLHVNATKGENTTHRSKLNSLNYPTWHNRKYETLYR